MEITRDNFLSALPAILNSIQAADFVAFDTEFTGFVTAMDDEGHEFDTLEDKYLKLKVACERFWPCQLGICTFKYDSEQRKFVAEPYSIYLLPFERYTPLSAQASCMQFLAENKFDLVKLFTKGVSYCRESDFEDEFRKLNEVCEVSLLSDERQSCMDSIMQMIKDFINAPEKSLLIPINSEYNKKVFYSNRGPATKFTGIAFTTKVIDDRLYIEAVKSKKGARCYDRPPLVLETDPSFKQEKRAEILGATQIIQALISHRKPLIGHNMIYDIGYIYHHMIEPLPPTLLEFKIQLRKTLTPLYDTKMLATKMFDPKTFPRSHLDGLYNIVTTSPKFNVNCSIVLGFDTTQKLAHDAGYDAYMTGCIFLYLSHTLMANKNLNSYWEAVIPIENRINMMLNHINSLDVDEDIQLEDPMFFENVMIIEGESYIDTRNIAKQLTKYGDLKVKKISEKTAIAKFDNILDSFTFDEILNDMRQVSGLKVESLRRAR